jgi:hypothetical protein
MDELAALIIEKLREDDGPQRGMVALASWWSGGDRLNLMVQPVVRNGMLSYNILKSVWTNCGYARRNGWSAVYDELVDSLQLTTPVCNFETLEQVANFLLAMGKSGECPHSVKGGVYSLAIGEKTNGLFRVKGASCATDGDVLMWLSLMRDMRAPVV